MLVPPKVSCQKPALPTLWLDTSVVIKLTKISRGEALEKIEVERLSQLQALIRDLTSQRKLLCPQADQEEEYVAQRLDREVHGDFLTLSVGIRMRHRQGIFDHQVQLGMQAYVAAADELTVPIEIFFRGNPVEELGRALDRPFLIGLNPFRNDELIARQTAVSRCTQIADGRLRLFNYLSRFNTKIIGF